MKLEQAQTKWQESDEGVGTTNVAKVVVREVAAQATGAVAEAVPAAPLQALQQRIRTVAPDIQMGPQMQHALSIGAGAVQLISVERPRHALGRTIPSMHQKSERKTNLTRAPSVLTAFILTA